MSYNNNMRSKISQMVLVPFGLDYPRAASEIHPKKRKFLEKNVKSEMHLVPEVLNNSLWWQTHPCQNYK